MKQLCLDGVEVGELVEHLEAGVVQGCHWQRLKVQQVSVGRVALGQDQVLERQGAVSLATDPPEK